MICSGSHERIWRCLIAHAWRYGSKRHVSSLPYEILCACSGRKQEDMSYLTRELSKSRSSTTASAHRQQLCNIVSVLSLKFLQLLLNCCYIQHVSQPQRAPSALARPQSALIPSKGRIFQLGFSQCLKRQRKTPPL